MVPNLSAEGHRPTGKAVRAGALPAPGRVIVPTLSGGYQRPSVDLKKRRSAAPVSRAGVAAVG